MEKTLQYACNTLIRFGDIKTSLFTINSTTLACYSPNKRSINPTSITCFQQATLCSVPFNIILINNVFNFTYIYNNIVTLNEVIPDIVKI